MPLLWLEQAPRCEHVTLGDESSKGTEVSAACLPTPGTPRGSRSPHQGPGRGEGVGRMAGPSVPQLTTGRGLGLATPLLLGLPAQACGGTAAGRVQLAQRGGSRLLLFGSLVSSFRGRGHRALPRAGVWLRKGLEGMAGCDDVLHLQEAGHGQHIIHVLGAQAQLGCVHELQHLTKACRVTDVQVYHVLLVHKEHLEVLAAGRQNCLMGFEVNTVHHKSAVTQQSQLPLLVQLLQDVLAVLGKIHGSDFQVAQATLF